MIFLSLLIAAGAAHAAVTPQAKKCAEKFFAAYDPLEGYTALIKKTERAPRGGRVLNEQRIRLTHRKPVYVKVEFLDKGSTGIKNNGMISEYDGGRKQKVTLGKPTFAGALMNRAAKAVIGDALDLFSPYSTDKEYLTLNRTSLTNLAHMLKAHMKAMEESERGGLSAESEGGGCRLRYAAHAPVFTRTFSGIPELEQALDEMAASPIFWVFLNLDQFRDLTDFYRNFAGKKIQISESSMPFELVLRPDGLPKELRFFHKSKEMASYAYEEITPLKK
jgi:hypothetical protein